MARHNETTPIPQPSTTGTLFYLLFGLIVWAAQLTLLYGAHTLVCALGASTAINTVIVGSVTIIAAAALLLLLLFQNRAARICGLPPRAEDRGTYDAITRTVCLLSLIAVFWTGMTAVIIEACAQGR